MNEKCEQCKFLTGLKHNFEVGEGYKEAFCCVLFAREEGGFAVEVENPKNDACEMFREKEGAV